MNKMNVEEKYSKLLTKDNMMGPNNLVLLEEAIEKFSPNFSGGNILDLGCGMGLTTQYLVKETDAKMVYATDLWISATQMWKNLKNWGVGDQVVPIHADALDLPYADTFFDGIVSVDAFHYFGYSEGVFAKKINPLIKSGGFALLIIPAYKKEPAQIPSIMTEWAEDETRFFHDATWWNNHVRIGLDDIRKVQVIELENGDRAWESWYASGHEYSNRDKEFFDRGLGEYITFITIYIEK